MRGVRNPALRRVIGPNQNRHTRKTYRPGIPSRLRNTANQSTPFRTGGHLEVVDRFLQAPKGTRYGTSSRKKAFDSMDKKWPCLLRLVGEDCTSARGSRGLAPFTGLKGVPRHMQWALSGETVAGLAKKYLQGEENMSRNESEGLDGEAPTTGRPAEKPNQHQWEEVRNGRGNLTAVPVRECGHSNSSA